MLKGLSFLVTSLDESMTPSEVVTSRWQLPLTFRPYQVKVIDMLADRPRAGYYADTSTGKTLMATASVLFKFTKGTSDCCIIVMPPILIKQWQRWLERTPGVFVTVYQGTPQERDLIPLGGQFVLMSIQIFKKDFERITKTYSKRKPVLIVDEAHSVKGLDSDNHKKVQDFTAGHELLLLTATPITSPMDGYAMVKLVAPSVYKSKAIFERIHVVGYDDWDKPTGWKNVDLLAQSMLTNAVRVIKNDVLKDQPPIYDPKPYELSPVHQELYEKLAIEQLLRLESGGKIDATTPSALYHALQKIIVNFDHYSGNPSNRSATFDLIDQTLEELNGVKLIICGNYRMTNEKIIAYLARYNAVSIYGGNSSMQNQRNIRLHGIIFLQLVDRGREVTREIFATAGIPAVVEGRLWDLKRSGLPADVIAAIRSAANHGMNKG